MMDTDFELPEDLTKDMEVLFVKPYSPKDMEYLRRSGSHDIQMKEIFDKANTTDPNFVIFEDTVAVVKTILGLGGYIIGSDLILLHGEKETLLKAEEALKDKNYTCFFDTVGGFLDFERSNGGTVIPAEEPLLH